MKSARCASATAHCTRNSIRRIGNLPQMARSLTENGVNGHQEQAQSHPPQERLWYFAYGSMCNPVSLNRRSLFPTESQPGLLAGYRLAFQLGGMANIVAEPGSTCHGVLHLVTPKEFEVLHSIEASYGTIQVQVAPYKPFSSSSSCDAPCTPSRAAPSAAPVALNGPDNGSSDCQGRNSTSSSSPANGSCITATAFIVQPESIAAMLHEHPEWANSLPSDRYIRIIMAGLEHYGADPAWVQFVAEQPCKLGRQLHEYLKIPEPDCQGQQQEAGAAAADLPKFTLEQLSAYSGPLRDDKAVFAVGPKVVEVDVSPKPQAPFVDIISRHWAGREVVFHTCMMLQEPRLPPLHSPADVQPEHIAWAEDALVEFVMGHGFLLRQIGWLHAGDALDSKALAEEMADAVEALNEEDAATAAPETGVLVQ